MRQYITRRLIELSRSGPIVPGKCAAVLGANDLPASVNVQRQAERLILRVTVKNDSTKGIRLKAGQEVPVRLTVDDRELFRFRVGIDTVLDAGGSMQIESEWP
jgi:hypothetical protein